MIQYKKGILPKNVQRNYVRNYTEYNTNIFCFDVETSSGYVKGNDVIPFKKGCQKEYEKYTKVALLYLWQFSINDTVYYGRELEEFIDCLCEVEEKYTGKKIFWVHNLSFEFQWLINVIPFQKIFAKKARRVIYAIINEVQFRCSYFLTHKSLYNWGVDAKLPVQKLIDTVDYTLLRTPKTTLDKSMLDYGNNDCLVMYYGLLQYVKRYKSVHNIPLTQTGEVRIPVKKILKSYKHHKKMTELLPKNAYEYAFMRSAFAGGATHANWTYSGETLKNIRSKDLTSAYPAAMCLRKFPMSRFEKVSDFEPYNNDDYSALLDITLYGVDSKHLINYLSASKCYYLEKEVIDNGKIMKAKKLSLICTNVDYNIITTYYKFKKIKFNDVRIAINQYLPKDFIEYTLDLYVNKTTLKDIEEEEGNYMTSKQFINALYGMMVSAIIHENIVFDDGEWTINGLTIDDINRELNDLREKPYKNFLAYQWGIWVTAYVRESLFMTMASMSDYVVYYDTDSIKYIDKKFDNIFDGYNNYVLDLIKKSSKINNIDINKYSPKDINGKTHTLGLFEDDKGTPYQEFRTLGAKRYAYRDCNGKLHMTVSGVNKIKGVEALRDDINNFNDNLIISEDNCKKTTLTYLSDMPVVTWNRGKYDEYTSKLRFGVHAEPTTYTLSITYEYAFLLENDSLDNFENYTAAELHDIIQEWACDERLRRKKKSDKPDI